MSQCNKQHNDDPNPVRLTKLLTFDHLDQSYLHDSDVFLKMRARAGRWTWCCLYGSDSVKCLRTGSVITRDLKEKKNVFCAS